jgi:hypothetical protein
MTWVVVDIKTALRSSKFPTNYNTIGGAKRAISRAINRGTVEYGHFVIKTLADYTDSVPVVTRYNLMTGEPFQIRADSPACCDPSTETYWSM